MSRWLAFNMKVFFGSFREFCTYARTDPFSIKHRFSLKEYQGRHPEMLNVRG